MNEEKLPTKKILIISAPIGSGHIRGAEALARAFAAKFTDTEPVICNVFDFFSPVLGKVILRAYLKILGFFPEIYRKMYGWGNEGGLVLKLREYVSRYLAGRMRKFIHGHNPALIVCTHATPAGLVAYLKREGKLTAPAAAVITDYVVHRLWVYPEFDHYFVATEEMAVYLREQGVEAIKIAVTGIPVMPSFTQPANKSEIAARMGLDPAGPTLLIMGGGEGLLPMDKIFEILNKTGLLGELNLKIIVVTGKNSAMCEKLNALAAQSPQPTKIFGYVENVHELMAISDILISKPGGMTAAEALATGLPMLIYRPLPGQEEANTRYLTKQGAAFLANSHSQLALVLRQILEKEPEKLTVMKEKAKKLGRPAAVFAITDSLEKYL